MNDDLQRTRRTHEALGRMEKKREALLHMAKSASLLTVVPLESMVKKIKRGDFEKSTQDGFRAPGTLTLIAPDSLIRNLRAKEPEWAYWLIGFKIPDGAGNVIVKPPPGLIIPGS